MVAPGVMQVMVTTCGPTYSPEPGLRSGKATVVLSYTRMKPAAVNWVVSQLNPAGNGGRTKLLKPPLAPEPLKSWKVSSAASLLLSAVTLVTTNVPANVRAPNPAIESLVMLPSVLAMLMKFVLPGLKISVLLIVSVPTDAPKPTPSVPPLLITNTWPIVPVPPRVPPAFTDRKSVV